MPSDGKRSHCLWQGELIMAMIWTLILITGICKVFIEHFASFHSRQAYGPSSSFTRQVILPPRLKDLQLSDTGVLQYTPSVSTIILSGPTYSSQNVRQIWESTLSKSDYLVGHFGRTWEWILKDFFLHFSRWICQTFCDRCVFVSVLSFRCVECAGT